MCHVINETGGESSLAIQTVGNILCHKDRLDVHGEETGTRQQLRFRLFIKAAVLKC